MAKRTISEADVRAVIANPRTTYGPTARGRIEHYGQTTDGRPLTVVMNATRTVIITVIDT
jgi:Domain of unknown function (DUF4258)